VKGPGGTGGQSQVKNLLRGMASRLRKLEGNCKTKRSTFDALTLETLKHKYDNDEAFRAEMCRSRYEEALAEARKLVDDVVAKSLVKPVIGPKELPADDAAPPGNRAECRQSWNC
jgi:hypothetical protein